MSQTKVEAPFIENNLPFRNKVINGDMNVAQRSTSVTGIGTDGNTYHTLDRMEINAAGSNSGRLTMTQTADGPGVFGLVNCLKLDCTTADTSIAAGELLQIQHKIEGQFLQDFHKGTSGAKKMTVSFYVKGNASAKYTLNLYDADNNRMNGQTFDVTTDWVRVTLVYDADTTGAFDNNNAASLQMIFVLHGGTTYSGGTFAENTWASYANNLQIGDSTTSFFDSTDRTFFITGLQLEVGDQATDFEVLPLDVQLQRCQRYCEVIADARSVGTGTLSSGDSDENIGGVGALWTTQYGYVPIRFATKKRSNAPSLYITNDTNHFRIYNNTSYDDVSTMTNSGTSSHHALTLTLNYGSAGWTAGHSAFIRLNNAAAYIMVIDEL